MQELESHSIQAHKFDPRSRKTVETQSCDSKERCSNIEVSGMFVVVFVYVYVVADAVVVLMLVSRVVKGGWCTNNRSKIRKRRIIPYFCFRDVRRMQTIEQTLWDVIPSCFFSFVSHCSQQSSPVLLTSTVSRYE